MNTNKSHQPPYPRLGELYRALAAALGTKGYNANIDELARKGEFNWALLPSLREELIVNPLKKYTDAEFANMIGQWTERLHEHYLRLVLTVPLDALSREESLPLLNQHYFSLFALDLISLSKKDLGGPDLKQFLDPASHPVAVVLAWLNEGESSTLAKLAYPKTTGVDRDQTEKLRKWTKGIDLPDHQSIIQFATALKTTGSIPDDKLKNLRRWLMIARTLAHLERESPVPFREAMLRHLQLGMLDFDIVPTLSFAVSESAKRFSTLTEPALQLYEHLKRTTNKVVGNQTKIKEELDKFELMTLEVDPEGRTRYHIEWMYGRWHVLSGNYELALQHYEVAVDLANYRAGIEQKQIVEEALVLAAVLRKKVLLKRLKHWAIAFELFVDPQGNSVIEDWEINHLTQQFDQLFPPEGRFPEAPINTTENMHLPFLMLAKDDFESIKLDPRAPDRVMSIKFQDGQVRKWSQLRFFTSFNKFEEVKTLLNLGASVDKLDESGGSALLCAIQEATRTGDRQILDLLLTFPHSASVINSITAKKQITPLLCAIDYGEPDVVEKLLSMGAAADLGGNIINQTPLYFAVERLGAIRNPEKLYRHLYRALVTEPDLVHKEISRRYNISLNGVFGDGDNLRQFMGTPQNAQLFERLVSSMVEEQINRHSIPKLIRIIELLLGHKANPNTPHHYPEPGRTPMMLAAENNSAQAFDLMLRHNGNPYQTDKAGANCLKIAIGFRSGDVVGYMRSKGIL